MKFHHRPVFKSIDFQLFDLSISFYSQNKFYQILTSYFQSFSLKRTPIVVLLIFTKIWQGNSQIPDFKVAEWQVIEIILNSNANYPDPFNNLEVMASFMGPNGIKINRPAFWDGGKVWKVRFAPTKIGLWQMITNCTISSDKGLHNISKTIDCQPYNGALEIYKKGFLKSSPGGRYFTFNNGTPFFYLGDTHWLFTHERFSKSNVAGISSQFKYIVDKRVSQGFTVYQTEAIQQPHGGIHNKGDEEPFCNFRDGFTSADLPGFQNMDRKFKYIAEKGLVNANSSICWVLDPLQFPEKYSAEYLFKLSKYWVARYGAYPVMYTLAQEIDKDMYGKFNENTLKKWYAVGQAIIEFDDYKQPVSAHMENTEYTVATNSTFGKKPYHTWWAVQSQSILNGHRVAENFWNNRPIKPSILFEAPYEGFATDAKGARSYAYQAFQNGMYGYGYGANGVWNDLYNNGDFGTNFELPKKYLNWYKGVNLLGADQLTFFKKLYTSIEWWKLTPRFDNDIWASFSDPEQSLLSTDKQNIYLVYFFANNNKTGKLKNMLKTDYWAKWYNPITGNYQVIGQIKASNGEWNIPNRPSTDDWILLVQSASNSEETDNLAINKTYSSSSNFNTELTDNKAFDKNKNTYWKADNKAKDSEWLIVKFDTLTSFNQINIFEFGQNIQKFNIEYSVDSLLWKVAFSGDTIGNQKEIKFETVVGHYVKINFTKYSSLPAIYEFEIYNKPNKTENNLALDRTYQSSSNWDLNQTAAQAFDGLLNTNWQASVFSFQNEWLSVDFGDTLTFDKIVLSEYGNRTKGFKIEVSKDGNDWQNIYTGNSIGNSKTIDFKPITNKFVRIFFTSGESFAPIIYEFEVYYSKSNSKIGILELSGNAFEIEKTEEISAFPNPFNTSLTIMLSNKINQKTKISIFNNTGALMKRVFSNTGLEIIDTSSWTEGVFFVLSEIGTKINIKKVVLKK